MQQKKIYGISNEYTIIGPSKQQLELQLTCEPIIISMGRSCVVLIYTAYRIIDTLSITWCPVIYITTQEPAHPAIDERKTNKKSTASTISFTNGAVTQTAKQKQLRQTDIWALFRHTHSCALTCTFVRTYYTYRERRRTRRLRKKDAASRSK